MMREELEAAIWRLIGTYGADIHRTVDFVDELLTLADAYSAGDSDYVTALRRQVLERETEPGLRVVRGQ